MNCRMNRNVNRFMYNLNITLTIDLILLQMARITSLEILFNRNIHLKLITSVYLDVSVANVF